MKRLSLALVFPVLCAVFFISCTEEKVVVYSEPTVNVTGTVYAWRCGLFDGFNNGNEVRYTVTTGLPATVKLIREDNCCTFAAETDDSSVFNLSPEMGDYFAVVETPHGCPDTFFNIQLTRDTSLRFDIVYDYLTPDTVYVVYDYPNPAESLGSHTEWLYVRSVDDWSRHMLDLDGVQRKVEYLDFMDWVKVTYSIPTLPEYAPWMVEAKVIRYINGNCVPPEFTFRLDWYICRIM